MAFSFFESKIFDREYKKIQIKIEDIAMRDIVFKNLAGIILLPAQVNNVEGWVAFDTGAMQTTLNKNYFIELMGKEKEVAKFNGEAVTDIAFETCLSAVSIGGITVNDLPVLLMDMEYVEKSLRTIEPNLRFLGSVGIELIRKTSALVDYANSRITLDPKIDINGAEILPISLEILPVITLELADKKYKFVLDTGANTCLLSTELIGKIQVSPTPDSSEIYTIPMIKVGRHEYTDVSAVFTDLSHIQNRVSIDGVIGSQVISKQLTLFDFQNSAIYLFDGFH